MVVVQEDKSASHALSSPPEAQLVAELISAYNNNINVGSKHDTCMRNTNLVKFPLPQKLEIVRVDDMLINGNEFVILIISTMTELLGPLSVLESIVGSPREILNNAPIDPEKNTRFYCCTSFFPSQPYLCFPHGKVCYFAVPRLIDQLAQILNQGY
ncbi:hypothetical protein CONCODRAFT_9146 [Conidiobolus coronatus NRRL 28638]|uniref:Uncharacterized protein n=1 Tax=Conidiobolus coronatus (strain ATCC 28846 / CBS 209.66 / NRRL 28638) TaxID=796925 RepID=A0A137P0E9_CONC2|nr:hypothetical protein CONCODRAFT_9146 [Conidiobolus coronatus NRRL 28638]|eukprot:KXN68553.1 hypothetical protein CONCODRAFT_9146 [Conidiobolus coronatus NRRL 28638]